MNDRDKAYWLADKIHALGDYAKEAAQVLKKQADEIERLREALELAADVARNACEGWNDALMHEGSRIAADAVQELLVPNSILRGGSDSDRPA